MRLIFFFHFLLVHYLRYDKFVYIYRYMVIMWNENLSNYKFISEKKRNINNMSRIFKPDYEIHSDEPKTYLIGSNQEMSHNF